MARRLNEAIYPRKKFPLWIEEENLCWTLFLQAFCWSFSFFPGLMWQALKSCKEENMTLEYAIDGVISLLLLGYLVYALLWPERF